MKYIVNTIFAFAALAALMFQSCSMPSAKQVDFEKQAAADFNACSDLIIKSYTQAENLFAENGFNDAMISALGQDSTAFCPSNLINDSLRSKIEFLRCCRQAADEYNLLSDNRYVGKQNAFSKIIKNIYGYLASRSDSLSLAYAKGLESNIKSSRYNPNDVMRLVALSVTNIFELDTKSVIASAESDFSAYSAAVQKISPDVFSEEKLIKYVYQPYNGRNVLVKAYKLNLVKERFDVIKQYTKSTDNISSALYNLNSAFTELVKDEADEVTVSDYLQRAEVFINVDTEKSEQDKNE